jgi:hypothetical protein
MGPLRSLRRRRATLGILSKTRPKPLLLLGRCSGVGVGERGQLARAANTSDLALTGRSDLECAFDRGRLTSARPHRHRVTPLQGPLAVGFHEATTQPTCVERTLDLRDGMADDDGLVPLRVLAHTARLIREARHSWIILDCLHTGARRWAMCARIPPCASRSVNHTRHSAC